MGRFLSLSCLALLMSTQALASPIYKWVDKHGNTHFASQPPEHMQAAPVNPAIAPAPPQNATQTAAPAADAEQEAIDQKVKKEVAADSKQLKEYCQTQRNNIAQLTNNPRVRVEENGQSRRLTEEERQEKIQTIKASVAKECQES